MITGSVQYPRALATELIEEFGSLSDMVVATPERIRQATEANPGAARAIIAMQQALRHVTRARIEQGPELRFASDVMDYVSVHMRFLRHEQVRVLYLTDAMRLIRAEVIANGDETAAYFRPRDVIERALQLRAANLVLIHNHPSGDPTPSRSDHKMTADLSTAGKLLDIRLVDHLVASSGGIRSLRDDVRWAWRE